MAININFFRNNDAGRIDYEELLAYFDELEGFSTYMSEDEVEMVFVDKDFNFSYRYLITKKSRVNQIYKLSPKYTNVNFLLEMPVLIPTFIAKEILSLCQKICKAFELDVYHDSFDDVKQFNMVTLLSLFHESRDAYIEEYGSQGKLPFDEFKLDEICKYQRSIGSLREYLHNEIDVEPCDVIIDRNTNEYGICSTFNSGIPTLFPPHIDFVRIHDEENIEFMVRRADFFTLMGRFLDENRDDLPNMSLLKPKKARQSRKVINKLRKVAIVDSNFESLNICDLIDKE